MARLSGGLQTSGDVRRYMNSILARVEKGDLDIKTAKALSSIAYQIQQCIYGEIKVRELEATEKLVEELAKYGQ